MYVCGHTHTLTCGFIVQLPKITNLGITVESDNTGGISG